MNNPQKLYCVETYDKNGNRLSTRYFDTLKEAKEAFKESGKRLWIEVDLIKIYEEDDSYTTETIDVKEIELHL